MIQAQTGERSFTVSSESVENLPVSGRNFASFVALAPGVSWRQRHAHRRRPDQLHARRHLVGQHRRQSAGHPAQPRRDRRSEGRHVRLPGRVRPHDRHTDLRHHQERHEPVSRIGLRHRAAGHVECEHVGERPERQSQAGAEGEGLGIHDRRPGRKARRHEQVVLLLLRTVRPAHERRRGESLPRADAARAAGDFSQTTDNNGRALQSDP